jgi:hypothetical protein
MDGVGSDPSVSPPLRSRPWCLRRLLAQPQLKDLPNLPPCLPLPLYSAHYRSAPSCSNLSFLIEAMMSRAWSWPAIAVWAGCALPIHANYTDATLALGSVFPLQKNAGTTELFPMPLCNGFKLEEATIDQMQQALNQRQLNSQQLITCYLRRIYQTEQYIKYDFL